MKILLQTLLLALMLSGCINRTRKAETARPDSTPVPAAKTPEPEDSLSQTTSLPSLLDSVEHLLATERRMRAELVEKLERSTPAEADSLYRSGSYIYLGSQKSVPLWPAIEGLTNRMCECNELIPGDSTVIKLLLRSGIVFEDIGEGLVEAQIERYYYYNIFEPYLSPETRRYARLMSDNNTLMFADAVLCPSLDTLYQRCLRWEAFLNDYPHTVYRPQIGRQYKWYMENILFCKADNTPTFGKNGDYDRVEWGMIDKNTLEEIQKLAETGQGTRTHQIIMQYLSELSSGNNHYSEELEKRISALYAWPETAGDCEQTVSNEK